eukprot:SAG11_NODE_15918_length_562_cov_3.317495_1_plen_61_part_01
MPTRAGEGIVVTVAEGPPIAIRISLWVCSKQIGVVQTGLARLLFFWQIGLLCEVLATACSF